MVGLVEQAADPPVARHFSVALTGDWEVPSCSLEAHFPSTPAVFLHDSILRLLYGQSDLAVVQYAEYSRQTATRRVRSRPAASPTSLSSMPTAKDPCKYATKRISNKD